VSVTGTVKLLRARLIFRAPLVPLVTVNVAGEADNTTPLPGVMVNAIVTVVAVMPVPVPRTVMVVVPSGVAALVTSVSVVKVPVPVLGFGTNDAVTPAGRFSAVKFTLPAKFDRARATLVLPVAS
jgi:hypothetical protein